MKTWYLISIFTLISYFNSYSQISKIWDERYSSNVGGDELVIDAQTDTSGNTYVAGYVKDSSGVYDIIVMKYNSNGNRDWIQVYDDSSQMNNYVVDLTLDPFGNVYIIGYNSWHTKNIWLKYNGANGALLWKKVTTVNNTDPYPVKALVDQNNYLCTGFSNFHVGVVDFNGNSVIGYPRPAITNAQCYYLKNIYIDNNNNIYRIGEVDLGFSCANSTYLVNKINSWTVNDIGNSGQYVGKNYATNMVTDNSGNNVYVVSQQGIFMPPDPSSDILVTKFNSATGNNIWEYKIMGDVAFGQNYAAGIKLDQQGNVLVLGTVENTASNFDIVLTKLSPTGTLIWKKTYNNLYNTADGASDLVIDGNLNIYVTGKTKDASGKNDFITLKYSSSGTLMWNIKYNGTLNWNDYALKIGIDNLNDVYVSGNSSDSTLYYSMMTVKYSCFLPNAPDSFLVMNTNPCAGEVNVPYSVNTQANQTYSWTYSGTGTTFNGTSNSVTANFSSAATSGTINVFANNACGSSLSPLSLAVNVNPEPEVTLTSFTPVCVYDPQLFLTGGSPAGGTYSGTGISGDFFDPAIAGTGNHTVTYTYTDTTVGCSIFASAPLSVSACTGINELPNSEITLFPNPNNGLFTITAQAFSPQSGIEIYNLWGEVVYKTVLTADNTTEIDLSEQPKGVYFYKVSVFADKVLTGKIVLQ